MYLVCHTKLVHLCCTIQGLASQNVCRSKQCMRPEVVCHIGNHVYATTHVPWPHQPVATAFTLFQGAKLLSAPTD